MKIIKKYLGLKENNASAFTLMESLIALIVISGTLLVYQGLSHSVLSHITYLRESDQDKWLLFAHQFRSECRGARFRSVRDNRLYIEKDGKELAFGYTGKKDFRKASAQWHGYHPMLLNLSNVHISEHAQKITLVLKWPSGLERTFIYDFKEKS
ncbi:membrane protein [Streptococcus porcinus]|uniref:competence type IV pilus minor pilin ComGF n=1 Tax=Streptococcus porcinus TaxID=1340 RepID=UPI0010CACFDD|nr:competence type IV pilus minor pilin ComGF [Streptococcus porcinus]VTS15798.1 membrane protein [Streptococcus porcinus]